MVGLLGSASQSRRLSTDPYARHGFNVFISFNDPSMSREDAQHLRWFLNAKSGLQTTIALSTTEAELTCCSWSARYIIGLSNFLKEAFPPSSLGSSTYSNKEAMKFSIDAVNKAGKIIGQAQKRVVDIFTSELKNKKYDRIDLSRSIFKGNIRDTSFSKREVLKTLFYDLKDRFVQYGRRKK